MTERRGVLIGCGFFARNHMQAWAQTPGMQIVAVCDTDPAKAADFASEFGVADAYVDAQAMLLKTKPDYIDIATTVGSHRVLVETAAQHSGLVVCQKPFAETLEDGRAMVAACTAAGATLMVHENFRWQKPFRALHQAVKNGAIGTPHFLRLSFRHAHDIYANQPYLAEVEDLALTDVGLHLFDLARFLVGDVVSVSCQSQRLNRAVKGDDAFAALLRHTSGAVSSVECSFHSHLSPDPFPQTLARMEGDAGTLELGSGYRLRLHRDGILDTDVEPAVPVWGARPWHCIQESVLAFQGHVAEVLAGRATPQPSGAHNMQTLGLTMAAIRSARSGRTVDLAEFMAEEGN